MGRNRRRYFNSGIVDIEVWRFSTSVARCLWGMHAVDQYVFFGDKREEENERQLFRKGLDFMPDIRQSVSLKTWLHRRSNFACRFTCDICVCVLSVSRLLSQKAQLLANRPSNFWMDAVYICIQMFVRKLTRDFHSGNPFKVERKELNFTASASKLEATFERSRERLL
jgi:hypothetical protein